MRKFHINTDYAFFQKVIPVLGAFGVFGHLMFYFILRFGFGYWESWQLRLATALLYGALVFFPKEKSLTLFQKAYFETATALTLPGLFTILFLKNGCNVYWYASLVFAGLLHGLLTKPYLYAWTFPASAGIATAIFSWVHPGQHQLVMESLQAQLIAYFLGVVTSGIKTTMEITHEKIMVTQMALSKAENDLLTAEATRSAYEELKKREELIRLYVRPSLVEEIQAGKDPSKSEPVIKNLSIMFCDIREFTKLTETLTPYERQIFLNQYFSMMTRPIVQYGGEVDKIMGDCVMSIFPDGAKAVQAAIAMRLELQKFNEAMFAVESPMIRNGIGIAKGDVMLGNFGSFEKLDRTVIGEAVNIASRLESKTKMYNLEVVVTEDVIKDLAPGSAHYRWIDNVQVKGSTRHLKLYEIYGHQPPEVRQYKDDTRDMLEKALTIYFQKGFKDASRLFRAMLERVPPHRLNANDLMDNILRYYIAHCDAWINNPTGTWEDIQRWEGVHVFTEK
ncbi:MAG: adenylate/guanylate cyclase domain-containing protein [Fibrobacteria bacterium]